jgi:hypothetical protein
MDESSQMIQSIKRLNVIKIIMGSKLLMRIWEERIKITLISNYTSLH